MATQREDGRHTATVVRGIEVGSAQDRRLRRRWPSPFLEAHGSLFFSANGKLAVPQVDWRVAADPMAHKN